MEDVASFAQMRAESYGLLSTLLIERIDERASAVLNPLVWQAFPSDIGEAFDDARNQIIEFCETVQGTGEGRSRLLDELGADYTRLFVGLGFPQAPLWESLHRGSGRVLGGQDAQEVRRLMVDRGFDVPISQFADHLGYELAFLAKASERLPELDEGEELAHELHVQADFIRKHPLFVCEKARKQAQTYARFGFYPALLALVGAFLAWDSDACEAHLAADSAAVDEG